MFRKFSFALTLLVLLLGFFLTNQIFISPVQAVSEGTFSIGKENGLGVEVDPGDTADSLLQRIINNAITIIYSVGAVGVFIYFVWGAVDWIFAGGDKEKIGSARKKMTQSLIGLLLLSLSGVIIVVVGEIVGFGPLKELKIPGLGDRINTVVPRKP